MRNPYDIIGVSRTASEAEIKKAYRKLAKSCHPDRNAGDPKAKDRFAEVNAAYEIVGDAARRAQFDRGEIDADGKPRFQGFPGGGGPRGRAGPGGFESYTFRSGGAGPGQGGGAFEDILNSMFGGGMRGARPGAGSAGQFEFDTGGVGLDLDVNVAMSVSLEIGRASCRERV